MPALAPSSIKSFYTQALLAKGFTKKFYDSNGVLQEDKTSLPPMLAKMVDGLSVGDSTSMAAWMLQEIVTIPVTSAPGTPSVGILP